MADKQPNLTISEITMLVAAIDTYLASLKRGFNTSKRTEFKAIFEKDIALLNNLRSKITQ